MNDLRTSSIPRADHLRCSPTLVQRVPGFKEWTYFCVSTPHIDLLLSFTFLGRLDDARRGEWPPARLVVLARSAGGHWEGGVEEFPPDHVRATPGRIDLAMGASEMRFHDGAYEIAARLDAASLEARLRLKPLGLPAVGTSVRMGAAEPMRWIVVPRLEAEGTIVTRQGRYRIAAAPAYHDHNWGTFSWGGDFAWEWGLILPATSTVPWTVVYSRITDRARLRLLSQAILVWREDSYCRAFRDDEIRIDEDGLLGDGAKLRAPRVVLDERATADVPRELVARARSGGDRIEVRFKTLDFAEIALPNDSPDPGTTLLREVRAEAAVSGAIRGRRFEFSGPAMLELNRGTPDPLGASAPPD